MGSNSKVVPLHGAAPDETAVRRNITFRTPFLGLTVHRSTCILHRLCALSPLAAAVPDHAGSVAVAVEAKLRQHRRLVGVVFNVWSGLAAVLFIYLLGSKHTPYGIEGAETSDGEVPQTPLAATALISLVLALRLVLSLSLVLVGCSATLLRKLALCFTTWFLLFQSVLYAISMGLFLSQGDGKLIGDRRGSWKASDVYVLALPLYAAIEAGLGDTILAPHHRPILQSVVATAVMNAFLFAFGVLQVGYFDPKFSGTSELTILMGSVLLEFSLRGSIIGQNFSYFFFFSRSHPRLDDVEIQSAFSFLEFRCILCHGDCLC
jgi:hypothetical protein